MKSALAFAAALAIVTGVAGTAQAQTGDAKKGREIYVKVGCWGCHGYEGQGGVTGPKLAPNPMPADALLAYLRNASATRMPPYDAKGLPDGDVVHIQAFLASVPKPGDWKSVPLLKQ